MNAIEMIQNEPVIKRRGGKFTVKLSSVGNPDFGQDPDRPMYGVPSALAHVETLFEARALVAHYIAFFDLGGGNWSGGEVVRADGVVVGRFSYNLRLWKDNGSRKHGYGTEEIIIDDQPARGAACSDEEIAAENALMLAQKN